MTWRPAQRRNQDPLCVLLALDYDLRNGVGRHFDDGEPQMSRPNILIVTVDQLTGLCLFLADRPASPALAYRPLAHAPLQTDDMPDG